MSFISAQNLTLGYDKTVVTENLNFKVEKGDYLCIVGENGSGKSTLMKTMLGLQTAIDGQILFGDGLMKNEIGYLPQQTIVQRDFPASVYEIVLSGCQSHMGLRPFYTEKERALASKNMERMDIYDLKNKCYRELSGGQQQRVLLARALCATTKVLLLDEPVSGLDPKVTHEMYELIKDLNDSGVTIIMVSHDISAAVKYASHILHIGKALFFGTKEEYVASKVGKFFLNMEGGELV
ncbi:MAG: metal ABC transporter ATP-binding protein [Butyrivibrio sp.]|nr:metal ABC transporter ATP-binding protein [Butyrivibrio sp.]